MQGYTKISKEEAQEHLKQEKEAKKLKDQARLRVLHLQGFSAEAVEHDTY